MATPKPVRKVNRSAGPGKASGSIYPGTVTQFKAGGARRGMSATRGAVQRKRDAVKRGAEGPKKSMKRGR